MCLYKADVRVMSKRYLNIYYKYYISGYEKLLIMLNLKFRSYPKLRGETRKYVYFYCTWQTGGYMSGCPWQRKYVKPIMLLPSSGNNVTILLIALFSKATKVPEVRNKCDNKNQLVQHYSVFE